MSHNEQTTNTNQTSLEESESNRQEEYSIWKKNTPYLYDTVGSYELEWPSLTAEWFPDKVVSADNKFSLQRLLLGTHTSGGEQNSLVIAQIKLPVLRLKCEEKFYNEESEEFGGFGQGGSLGKLEIQQKINHPGEVNRARHMPQNPDIIATKTATADVLVFDRTKHASQPGPGAGVSPQMKLIGHQNEGYGLGWSPFREGCLLSGSDDGLICLWDVKSSKTESAAPPLRTFSEHKNIVEDVAWHRKDENFFASASDDLTVKVWDSRVANSTATINGHRAEVNCVSFSAFHDFLLLSGSKDAAVTLWDLRNPTVRLHVLEGHEDAVFRVDWAPFSDSILASCGADARLIIWDLKKIGVEQTPEDAEDGPPELVFVHGGHTDKISDFGWCPHDEWTVASVADDNVLQAWTVSEEIYLDAEKCVAENTELE